MRQRRTQSLIIAWLSVGLCLAVAPSQGAPRWTVCLADSLALPAGEVRLATVATGEIPAAAASIVVVEEANPGTRVTLHRRSILRQLVGAGLAAGVRFRGAEFCHITFVGQPLRETEITDWLHGALQPWVPPPTSGAPATWLAIELRVPRFPIGEKHHFELVDPQRLQGGRNLVRVRIEEAKGSTRLTASVICHVYGEVATAVTSVRRDSELSPDQFSWEWRDLAELDQGLVVGRTALQGQSSQRGIAVGRLLRQADLKNTPLVRSGDTVELQRQRGSVQVTVMATARQEGCLGDLITVRSHINGNLVTARIVGSGQVEWKR